MTGSIEGVGATGLIQSLDRKTKPSGGPEISWFSPPVGVDCGYGNVAVSLINAIQEKKVKVDFVSSTPKVHISFCQPHLYMGKDNQYRVGYTPWESTAIQQSWVDMMNRQDEIWTTSDFCVEVFEQYKVNDIIRKVQHGISPSWKIYEREIGDKFTFFHIGAPAQRKGGQMVVDAFLELYDGNEEYQLLMKSGGVSDCRARSEGVYLGNARNHPQITIIEDMISEDDLYRLYKSAHCMVYPTNGEGWGLIPWQAIATGMPTICTNATGCTEFAELSVPLDSTPGEAIGIHLGNWVNPSYGDLLDKMKWVVENYAKIRETTIHSARVVHDTRSWSDVADTVLGYLGNKVEKLA